MTGHHDQFFGGRTYSQHGEDLAIANIFWLIGVEKPSYLDLGAHHPTIISNTALLYNRGSRGVNVEANPNLMTAFHQERPHDVNVNIGVGPLKGMLPFYMIDGFSGRNTFYKDEADRFICEHPEFRITEVREVPVITINDVVKRHCGDIWPNFLSMDLEGLDGPVLMSADFSITKPMVICVESRRGQGEDQVFFRLHEQGYLPHSRMGENVIYVDRRYAAKVFP